MPGFHKDKATNKWYCDKCNEEISKEILLANYNYFGENKEHICRPEDITAHKGRE